MESETTTMRFQFLSSMMGFNRTSVPSAAKTISKKLPVNLLQLNQLLEEMNKLYVTTEELNSTFTSH
ncbi:hypothetical protein T01_11750 [Trichinella spiralis]|uniref:Uncharacterized protein n=1 Tax=Trichinella spiralis TaxID=6334 RepID=A0A0V1B3I9_TRISP|nr:hypothetical protein T01_11750 [Trichinella spiralis]